MLNRTTLLTFCFSNRFAQSPKISFLALRFSDNTIRSYFIFENFTQKHFSGIT